MMETQTNDDVRRYHGSLVEHIEYLFDATCYCETDLNTKITMLSPGRTYTKLKAFKFNFNYLFALSSKRKDINANLKQQIWAWLNLTVPFEKDGVTIMKNYILAGVTLFSQYGDELQRIALITYKK